MPGRSRSLLQQYKNWQQQIQSWQQPILDREDLPPGSRWRCLMSDLTGGGTLWSAADMRGSLGQFAV